jgi:hypothetical protein
MTQMATIAYIGRAGDAPAELQGFINFRAGMAGQELKGDEEVAVLRIGATDCYHVLLLGGNPSMNEIEKELGGIEAALAPHAKKALKDALGPETKSAK